MTELDGAWAARVIARFTPELVEAAVRMGHYTDPRHTAFLLDERLTRQRAILAHVKMFVSSSIQLPCSAATTAAPTGRRSGSSLARWAG